MQISSPVILQESQIRPFNQQRKHSSFSHFLFANSQPEVSTLRPAKGIEDPSASR